MRVFHCAALVTKLSCVAGVAMSCSSTAIADPCPDALDVILTQLPCLSDSQLCGNRFEIPFDSCGLLTLEYTTAATHCSDIGMMVYLDGVLVAITDPLPPGTASPVFDLGPVAPGSHVLSLEAYGVEGGCNVGFLESWGGFITLHRCVEPPEIVTSPGSVAACPGVDAVFEVTNLGSAPFGFVWEVEDPTAADTWLPLTDGVLEIGGIPIGIVAASDSSTMIFSSPTAQFNNLFAAGAKFRCTVSNSCSSATSDVATYLVCIADFNCDAAIDFFDYLDFVATFAEGGPSADFNADTVVDFFDYLDFVAAFSNGC
jgi:hypothetical protein